MATNNCEISLPRTMDPANAYINCFGKTPNTFRKIHKAVDFSSVFITDPMINIFTAGILFLAKPGQNEDIKEIAETTIGAINNGLPIATTNNMVDAAIDFGLDEADACLKFNQSQGIGFFAVTRKRELIVMELPLVLLSPEFIARAKLFPVSALARTAAICSQITDFLNLKDLMDEYNASIRSNGAEAQILLEGFKRHKKLKLSLCQRRLLEKFPEGIISVPNELLRPGRKYIDTPLLNYEHTNSYADTYYPYN